MFVRMIIGALARQRGKMLMIAATVALGASLATSMLNVMLDVGDKVNKELKAYGANISVLPKGASLLGDLYGIEQGAGGQAGYLREDELGNIKTIFWAFNIVDFAPFLETRAELSFGAAGGGQGDEAASVAGGGGQGGTGVLDVAAPGGQVGVVGTWFDHRLSLPTGESVDTGIKRMKSWWDVSGEWPLDTDAGGAMVGSALAARHGIAAGDTLTLAVGGASKELSVRGVFSAGDGDDDLVYVPLAAAQGLAGRAGQVGRIEVSALTTPDNELARKAAQDPKSLSIKEWETWYCTAYVSAICYQIDEVVTGAVAKPVRQVAESEGAILEKTQLLMMLITALSLFGAALGISNLVTASVMERSGEVGLLKAVGANDMAVTRLVLAEILLAGIGGGAAGYFAGLGFAQAIGRSVFGAAIDIKPMVLPLVALLVLLVILAGSIPSIRLLLRLRPAEVLHGR